MLAFRAEVHVERWCETREIAPGYTLSLEQAWGLGREWYADRLSPDWRRRAPAEAEAVFGRLGLGGEFWRLS